MQSKFSGTSNSEYQPCNNRGIIHYPVYEDQGTTVERRRFPPSHHPSGTSRRQRYRIEKHVHYGNLAALGRSQQQTSIHHPPPQPPQPPPRAAILRCRLETGRAATHVESAINVSCNPMGRVPPAQRRRPFVAGNAKRAGVGRGGHCRMERRQHWTTCVSHTYRGHL